jgi:hypothetical protein
MLCVLSQPFGKESTMSTLTALKLVATKKPINISPVLVRRNKLSAKLWEQIEMARGQASGKPFVVLKSRTVKDAETGLRKCVDIPKRLRPWWWISEAGKVCVSIRYGSKVLELSKGKAAVEVANPDELVSTLEAVRRAVEAGELDSQIEAASGALKAGFGN